MPSIKQEITKGVFWIAVAKYSGIFISLVITAILARNISPTDFGTMSVATVLMAFLDIFTDMGIGPAIVQYKDLTKYQINSLFIVGCLMGFLLSGALFLLAPVISEFYEDPVLINICQLLAICVVFNSLNIVPNGLMMKDKRFKTVAVRTLFFQVICGILAVLAAIDGWGIYALVITPILSSIGVFTVNFYNYPQRFLFTIDFTAVKKVWTFSSFQFLFSVINYFSRNLDKLIICKYFSMTQFGYYDKAYRLMQMPLQNITYVIAPVLHPILSSLQNNKLELGNKNKKLIQTLANISFPVGILLFFCAPEIITIIFGDNWLPAVPVFKVLAISLPLQILLSTSGSIFQAAGRTDHLFITGLITTGITVIAFLIAAIVFKTIVAMAWAWNAALVINFFVTYFVLNRRTLKYPFVDFIKVLRSQILNSLVTVVSAGLLVNHLEISNSFQSLLIKGVVIVTPTIIMAMVLHQYNIFHVLKKIVIKKWECR